MEFICNQQYLHYSKCGLIYYFYVMNKNVYMKTFNDHQVYATVKIMENIIDYSVAIDDFDNFHLVSISSSGALNYSIYRDNKWDFRLLTLYDSKYYQFKNLKLFIVNNHIHILMAISDILDSESWILKHHYWNNQSWTNQKICTIITEKYDLPFHADIDSNHDMHIVFRSLYDDKYQIYYCKYHLIYNTWSNPIKISNPSYNHFHPFILCDNMKGIHIAWSSYSNNNMEIFYLYHSKMHSSENYFKKAQRLSNEKTNSTHPYIFQVANCIKVLWRQNNEYFSKSLNLSDYIWSEAVKIKFDHKHKLYPVSVIGHDYKSLINIHIPNAYGMLINDEFFIMDIDDLAKNNSNEEIIETSYLYDKMNYLIHTIQDIQKKHEDMNQLLNHLNTQQKLVDEKVDKLINYDKSLTANDKHLFEKLFTFFKS